MSYLGQYVLDITKLSLLMESGRCIVTMSEAI